jgi:hypothetical protein
MPEDNTKYLFPAFPIMHVGLGRGNGQREYPLSRVLGSWGYVIREICIDHNGCASVLCKCKDNSENLEFLPLMIPKFKIHPHNRNHYTDLILRYESDGQGGLSIPRWTRALFINFAAIYVVDVEEQKTHQLRLNDRVWYYDK